MWGTLERSAVSERQRAPRILVALAVYAVLAVLLSWPLLAHLDRDIIGHIDHPACRGDLFYQYDMQQQMEQGSFPRHRHLVTLNHPEGLELPPKDMFALHLLLYATFMTVLGLLAGHNLTVLLMMVLDALCMHALVRERTGREDFAYLSGLLFGFGCFVMLKVQQGFPQKACLFLLPLFVLFLLRAIERRTVVDHVLTFACFLGMLWVYPPYAFFDLLIAVPLIVGRALRSGRFWDDLWTFAPSLLAVVAVFAVVAYTQRGDPDTTQVYVDLARYKTEGGYMPLLQPFLWQPYANTFETPPVYWVPDLPLGFPIAVCGMVLLAVVIGARDARLMVLIALGLVVLMLGPYLSFGGEPGAPDATTIKLPFYYLASQPGGGVLRYPIRLFPWVLTLLLLAAGSGLNAIQRAQPERPRLARWVVLGLLAATFVESRVLFPQYCRIWSTPVPTRQFYDEIRDEDFAALMLLPPKPMDRNGYLMDPILSGKALVNGYWGGDSALEVPQAHAPRAEKEAFLDTLRAYDVGYVVVRLDNLDPVYLAMRADLPPGEVTNHGPMPYDWLDALCGRPRIYPGDAMAVYRLPDAD